MASTTDGPGGGSGKSRLSRRAPASGRRPDDTASQPAASPGSRRGGQRAAAGPAGTSGGPAGAATPSGAADAGPTGDPRPATNLGPTTNLGPAGGPYRARDGAAPGESGAGGGRAFDALAARRVPRHGAAGPGDPLPATRRGMLRYRLLPRSVIGISMLILSFAIGAGFSGVVLYSYYQYKQNQADTKVNALITGYKGQFAKAQADLNAAVADAKATVAEQLKGAQALQTGPAQLAALIKQMAPSVFFVHTLDAAGQPSVGSAFVISSTSTSSLLLTSYTTVAAATHAPAPPVYVRQGNTDTPVTLKTWDQQYDLALLILPRGNLTPLKVAPTSPAPQPGDRLFAVSGLGAAGASLTQGSVVDVSSSGLTVDDAIGTAFQGGPVVDQTGEVVAVGSRSYAPLGFTSSGVYFVPYVQSACAKVLTCPGGTLTGS